MTRSGVFLFCVLSGLLGGCASGPKYTEVASRIPPLEAGKGRVYFYREGSFVGSGIQPDVTVNGEKVGSSIPGGFFFVNRPAGNYEVRTATEAEYKVIFALGAGETKYVRTHISMGAFVGHVIPNLVDVSEGENQIRNCSYTGEQAVLLTSSPAP